MKIKIDVKPHGVPVTSLSPGTVFTYDGGEYGVRINDGWIIFDGDNAVAWIDSEEPSAFDSVTPCPNLNAEIIIS